MYKCLECGHEFEEPHYMMEAHGELYPHCPFCDGTDYADMSKFECDACYGVTADIGEQWCEECKTAVRQIMSYSITKCLNKLGLTLSAAPDIIEAYKDVFEGRDVIHEETEAKHLMCAIVNIAADRGCGIDTAWEMAEQWVYDSKFMK